MMNQEEPHKTVIRNKLTFLLNERDKTASVIEGHSANGEVLIPRSIMHESQEFIITEIGNGSFKYSKGIKTIKFAPDTELKKVGKKAFAHTTIKNISIPSCVSEIEDYWCDGIHRNNKITVMMCQHQNLLQIGKMIVGKSDTKSDTYDILYFVQRDIKKIDIPQSIKNIASCAFCNSKIQSITLSPHITQICDCAFSCCYDLKRFEVQEGSELKTIGKYAFAGSDIESLIIPSSIVEFGEGWCEGMQFLTNIKVFQSNENNISYFDDKYIIGKSDFNSEIFDVIIFARRDVKNVIVPPFITKIGTHSFAFSSLMNIEKSAECHQNL